MSFTKILLFVSFVWILASSCNRHLSVSSLYQQEGYHLVWADEFNRAGKPDSANWIYENGFVRNEELQWYQSENAKCENGLLIIEAKKETKPNPWFDENSNDWRKNRKEINYTSSC